MSDLSRRLRPQSAGVALLAAGVLSGAALMAGPGAAHAANAAVSATGTNTFDPRSVTILTGDSVTWTTTGGVNHTVTSSSANWKKDDSIPLVSRSTSFTFDKAGTYTYFCKTHGSPTTGMRGSVVVTAPKPAPRPTRTTAAPRPTASRLPTARPTTARPSPSRSAAASPTPAARPTPTRSAAGPPALGLPSVAPGKTPARAAVPLPSVAEVPAEPAAETSAEPLVNLGDGGLGPRSVTDRGRGLPTFLAVLALGGVVSAQVRALLAMPVSD
ncbi:MAG TPA: plastocyanin/azurin family copper-binding protein [Mycobacteriales bacterium]|nr:plastocyanin/azurin family copper-binding protein [Mycobacteriales bacterium]